MVCTLGIGTPGILNADASNLDKVSLHSAIPGKSCVLSQFPLLSEICHIHVPSPEKEWDLIKCIIAYKYLGGPEC